MDKPVFLAQRRRRNIKSQNDESKEAENNPQVANACHMKHAKPKER
jgi:hypothetical protein